MYMLINSMILAVMLPMGGPAAVQEGPTCRAEIHGFDLVTTLELPSGMHVEGPWRVVHRGEATAAGAHFVMHATLDRVVERDAITGQRNVIAFPEPVSLTFEGRTQRDLVQRAAQVWCVTVMRAQENRRLDRLTPTAGATRIASRSAPPPRG